MGTEYALIGDPVPPDGGIGTSGEGEAYDLGKGPWYEWANDRRHTYDDSIGLPRSRSDVDALLVYWAQGWALDDQPAWRAAVGDSIWRFVEGRPSLRLVSDSSGDDAWDVHPQDEAGLRREGVRVHKQVGSRNDHDALLERNNYRWRDRRRDEPRGTLMHPYRNSDGLELQIPSSRRMSVLTIAAAASCALSIATSGLVLVRLDATLPITPAACRETLEPYDDARVKCADLARLEVLPTNDRWGHPMVACRCLDPRIPPNLVPSSTVAGRADDAGVDVAEAGR